MRRRALVVDDSDHLRRLLARVLDRFGFEAFAVADGVDALRVAQSVTELSLLVTDIDTPRMDGMELAHEVAKRFPGVAVLYLTGGPAVPPDPFLAKPFSLGDFEAAVGRLVGGP